MSNLQQIAQLRAIVKIKHDTPPTSTNGPSPSTAAVDSSANSSSFVSPTKLTSTSSSSDPTAATTSAAPSRVDVVLSLCRQQAQRRQAAVTTASSAGSGAPKYANVQQQQQLHASTAAESVAPLAVLRSKQFTGSTTALPMISSTTSTAAAAAVPTNAVVLQKVGYQTASDFYNDTERERMVAQCRRLEQRRALQRPFLQLQQQQQQVGGTVAAGHVLPSPESSSAVGPSPAVAIPSSSSAATAASSSAVVAWQTFHTHSAAMLHELSRAAHARSLEQTEPASMFAQTTTFSNLSVNRNRALELLVQHTKKAEEQFAVSGGCGTLCVTNSRGDNSGAAAATLLPQVTAPSNRAVPPHAQSLFPSTGFGVSAANTDHHFGVRVLLPNGSAPPTTAPPPPPSTVSSLKQPVLVIEPSSSTGAAAGGGKSSSSSFSSKTMCAPSSPKHSNYNNKRSPRAKDARILSSALSSPIPDGPPHTKVGPLNAGSAHRSLSPSEAATGAATGALMDAEEMDDLLRSGPTSPQGPLVQVVRIASSPTPVEQRQSGGAWTPRRGESTSSFGAPPTSPLTPSPKQQIRRSHSTNENRSRRQGRGAGQSTTATSSAEASVTEREYLASLPAFPSSLLGSALLCSTSSAQAGSDSHFLPQDPVTHRAMLKQAARSNLHTHSRTHNHQKSMTHQQQQQQGSRTNSPPRSSTTKAPSSPTTSSFSSNVYDHDPNGALLLTVLGGRAVQGGGAPPLPTTPNPTRSQGGALPLPPRCPTSPALFSFLYQSPLSASSVVEAAAADPHSEELLQRAGHATQEGITESTSDVSLLRVSSSVGALHGHSIRPLPSLDDDDGTDGYHHRHHRGGHPFPHRQGKGKLTTDSPYSSLIAPTRGDDDEEAKEEVALLQDDLLQGHHSDNKDSFKHRHPQEDVARHEAPDDEGVYAERAHSSLAMHALDAPSSETNAAYPAPVRNYVGGAKQLTLAATAGLRSSATNAAPEKALAKILKSVPSSVVA